MLETQAHQTAEIQLPYETDLSKSIRLKLIHDMMWQGCNAIVPFNIIGVKSSASQYWHKEPHDASFCQDSCQSIEWEDGGRPIHSLQSDAFICTSCSWCEFITHHHFILFLAFRYQIAWYIDIQSLIFSKNKKEGFCALSCYCTKQVLCNKHFLSHKAARQIKTQIQRRRHKKHNDLQKGFPAKIVFAH